MAKAKRKAPVPSAPPELQIVTDGCQLFYADLVNVASTPDGVVFTVYQSAPDPSVLNKKGTVLYAGAIVKTSVEIGLKLPSLIIDQALKRANMTIEDVDLVIQETEKIKQKFIEKRKEIESGQKSG